MFRFLRWFLLLLLLTPVLLGAALLLAIEDRPAVEQALDLSPDSLARGQRILDGNDPRRMKSGQIKTVQLSEDELGLAVNYLVHRYAHGSARLRLRQEGADLALTLPLPGPLAGRYVNAEATLVPKPAGLPAFESLRLGRLSIPGGLADWLAARLLVAANGQEAVDTITGAIQALQLSPGRLALTYRWQADLPARLSSAMVPEAELERLRIYQQRLIELGTKAGKTLSLAELLQALLRAAGERSQTGDAVAENRAALVVLTFYVNRRGLDKLVPKAEPWPRVAIRAVRLSGRDDFPKHFIISAALAATADSPLSDAIGLYKEVRDSRGGSGFSFNDLAADRAGTRLGEMATASPEAARFLQQRFNTSSKESDFMPSTADLPEFMPEPEFKRRFGGIGQPAYNLMMVEIDRRVAELPLYRR